MYTYVYVRNNTIHAHTPTQNLPRAATYSDPFGGAYAHRLPGAFYRDGPHPDDGMTDLLTNQLSGIDNTQDRFHYSDQVYHFTPKW